MDKEGVRLDDFELTFSNTARTVVGTTRVDGRQVKGEFALDGEGRVRRHWAVKGDWRTLWFHYYFIGWWDVAKEEGLGLYWLQKGTAEWRMKLTDLTQRLLVH